MIDLVIKALSGPCPDRVVAGEPADAMNVLLTGLLPDSRGPFVCGEATAIGTGAHRGGDGTNGTANYGAGDLKNLPVEVIEARYPIRINSYSLRPGSAGLGRWRGGLGIERQYEMLTDDTKLSLWWERTKTPGWGLFGGGDGAPGEVVVETGGEMHRILKCDALQLQKGDRVTVRTGGGGGYGPLGERDPAALADDVVDGYGSEGGSS
jgi:N-methylhydantoinase B